MNNVFNLIIILTIFLLHHTLKKKKSIVYIHISNFHNFQDTSEICCTLKNQEALSDEEENPQLSISGNITEHVNKSVNLSSSNISVSVPVADQNNNKKPTAIVKPSVQEEKVTKKLSCLKDSESANYSLNEETEKQDISGEEETIEHTALTDYSHSVISEKCKEEETESTISESELKFRLSQTECKVTDIQKEVKQTTRNEEEIIVRIIFIQ